MNKRFCQPHSQSNSGHAPHLSPLFSDDTTAQQTTLQMMKAGSDVTRLALTIRTNQTSALICFAFFFFWPGRWGEIGQLR